MDFKQPQIDEQYIKLLEQSNLDLKEKTKIFTFKNILTYSGIFILVFILVYTITGLNRPAIVFKGKLEAVRFSPDKLLLEYHRKFYKIPLKESKKWLLSQNCMLTVSGDKMQFDRISDETSPDFGLFKLFIPSGKHYNLILSDGTHILLNGNSQISFIDQHITDQINVKLQGEAFFKVAHNTAAPFKIKASEMLVKVYGTTFNLSNYASQKYTQVALLKGSVKVETPEQSQFIVPGQQAVLNSKQKLEVKPADFTQITAWIDNSLYFKSERLIDIINKLENRYQIHFIIPDLALQNLKFTGKINKNDDLLQFLKILEYTEGIKYTIKNKCVTLTKNHQ